jgi:hypothetical protein
MTMSTNIHLDTTSPDAKATFHAPSPGGAAFSTLCIHHGPGYGHVCVMYPASVPFALVQAVRDAHNAALAAGRPPLDEADMDWESAAPTAAAILHGDAESLTALSEKIALANKTPAPPMTDLNPTGARPPGWTMSRMVRGQNPGSFHFWTFVHEDGRELRTTHPSEAGAWIELNKLLRGA